MNTILIALALTAAPAGGSVKVCAVKPETSSLDDAQRDYDERLELLTKYPGQPPSVVRALKDSRRDILSAKLAIGYQYLDAGCVAEARASFQSVWTWNSFPEYQPYPQQAREALNQMALAKIKK